MLSRSFALGLVGLAALSLVLRSPLLFLLTALLAFMAGASFVWDRYCLSGVSYARRLGASRLFCGEATALAVEVVNAKPLPLAWLKSQDEFPDAVRVDALSLAPAGEPRRVLLTNLFNLRWYERVRRHYRLTTTRRGTFDFGPVAVSSGDIFGFRTRRLDLDHRHSLLVYPKVVPLEQLPLRPARPVGEWGTRRTLTDDPFRLAGTREYAPGDAVRHIHWKASARRPSLQTKVFDPSASQQLFVCLNNQTLERAYGGILVDELETAIVVAASIAHAGLEARHPVGLVSNGSLRESGGLARLAASRHVDHESRLLELLAHLTYFTALPFEQMLRAEASRFAQGASLIAVTTLATDAILAELLNLQHGGHPVGLIVVCKPGAEPRELQAFAERIPTHVVTEDWTDLDSLHLA